MHPGRTADVFAGGTRIGQESANSTRAPRKNSGIDGIRVAIGEIDAESLIQLSQHHGTPITSPKFLPVEQDLAVVVANERPAAEVGRRFAEAQVRC
ncbi:MAG: hypothetical protein R2848_07940 [Thermomicrobiales bacterium]